MTWHQTWEDRYQFCHLWRGAWYYCRIGSPGGQFNWHKFWPENWPEMSNKKFADWQAATGLCSLAELVQNMARKQARKLARDFYVNWIDPQLLEKPDFNHKYSWFSPPWSNPARTSCKLRDWALLSCCCCCSCPPRGRVRRRPWTPRACRSWPSGRPRGSTRTSHSESGACLEDGHIQS